MHVRRSSCRFKHLEGQELDKAKQRARETDLDRTGPCPCVPALAGVTVDDAEVS
jgi:hypothetical protein